MSDTGQGIAPEILPRVWEPFYSMRPADNGTGLGLPICRRLVNAAGGTIDIESELGKGTTVRVVLPVNLSERRPEQTNRRERNL